MKSKAQILQEILTIAKTALSNDSQMGYTMPDGNYHIYIYADQATHIYNEPEDTFYVIEPNKVEDGAHEPMGDTFVTSKRDLSEVLIGCQWCMECFEEDREKGNAHNNLPNELVIRLAHEAGWLEHQGKIELHSWEDLQIAIHDAIETYNDNPNEYNPFTIEETIERILTQRYPSEPEPPKPTYKEICILTCSEEHEYGINVYASIHNTYSEALNHEEELRKSEEANDMYWNFDIETKIIDVSQFLEPSAEQLAGYFLQKPEDQKEKQSLDEQIQTARNTQRCEKENQTNRPDRIPKGRG